MGLVAQGILIYHAPGSASDVIIIKEMVHVTYLSLMPLLCGCCPEIAIR